MTDRDPPYPSYARSERLADAAFHLIGVAGALVGGVWLLVWAAIHLGAGQITALAIYGLALLATFTASAIYHLTPWERFRPVLRRIDHAAIYLKIAGTYTPLVAMIGGLGAWLVLAIVWALAAYGAVVKLFFWRNPRRNGTWLYLLMGWLSLLLAGSMFAVLPQAALILIAVGGGVYTLGTLFHHWESLKFSNAIWHGHVVVASACFFAAIALGNAALA